MCKVYQLTNNHKAPPEYPVARAWVQSGQKILVGDATLVFTVCALDTNQAFQLHAKLIDKNKKIISGQMLKVDSFFDLTQYGFLLSIRAAEWERGLFVPKRILVEFASLNKNVKLSVSK